MQTESLYAHIYTANEDDGATPVWVLAIGKTVIGNPSHGAAVRVGYFLSKEEAIAVAEARGVGPERVEVAR